MNFETEFDTQLTKSELEKLLEEAEGFRRPHAKTSYKDWHDRVVEYLTEHYTSDEISEFFVSASDLVFSTFFFGDISEEDMIVSYDHAKARKALRNIIRNTAAEAEVETFPAGARRQNTASRKIFVVHGHHEATKEAVARTLERLGLEPIILSEQPNGGKTIIEKFEVYSDVAFAVVLMTPDDKGAPVGTDFEKYRNRARQNVILELGYFISALKRDRVFVLKENSVEEPSDIFGVVYEQIDQAGHWRYALAKELRAAGFDVDLNLVG